MIRLSLCLTVDHRKYTPNEGEQKAPDNREECTAGLAGERSRWEVSIVNLEAQLAALPGDVALASAFMSYAGPFPSQYREDLAKHTWQKQVHSPAYHLCSLYGTMTQGCDHHVRHLQPPAAF